MLSNTKIAQAEAQQLLERIKSKTRDLKESHLSSSLSPLGVSLMPQMGPNGGQQLETVLESSIQSYTNETQQLMALSMAAYHELDQVGCFSKDLKTNSY